MKAQRGRISGARALLLAGLGALLAGACGAAGAAGPGAAQGAEDARSQARFVARLESAQRVRCTTRVSTNGAVAGALDIVHEFGPGETLFLSAHGSLAGRAVDCELRADGVRADLATPEGTRTIARPSGLRSDVARNLGRLGALHDVLRLLEGGRPESAATSPRQVEFQSGETLDVGGQLRRALSFALELDGAPRAQAVLWIDTRTGWPLERWQRVSLGASELRFVEEYTSWNLDGEVWASAPRPLE